MRDKLKNAAYFEERIAKIRKNIAEFETLLSNVSRENGINSRGAKNGRLILVNEYLSLIDCEYSYGAGIAELRQHYDSLLQIYTNSYSDNEQQSYTKLIKIISLGMLLNADASQFSELEQKLRRTVKEDYFLSYLLCTIDAEWGESSETFKYPSFYEPLKEVVEQQDPELLVEYDTVLWYKSHNEEPWYNSHKSKRNTYSGYWDYEGAAVAKILNMDPAMLQHSRYLPLDLIA